MKPSILLTLNNSFPLLVLRLRASCVSSIYAHLRQTPNNSDLSPLPPAGWRQAHLVTSKWRTKKTKSDFWQTKTLNQRHAKVAHNKEDNILLHIIKGFIQATNEWSSRHKVAKEKGWKIKKEPQNTHSVIHNAVVTVQWVPWAAKNDGSISGD